VQRTVGGQERSDPGITVVLVAPVLATAAMLTGCAAADGLMTSVQLPADGPSASASDTPTDAAQAGPGLAQAPPDRLRVTGQQRAYLDALAGAGVRPSSELLALRIGSYICQARAAGQSPQAVWDSVHPLVRSDVGRASQKPTAPARADVDAATNGYIRIATERLC
jgi:hypothetical protein